MKKVMLFTVSALLIISLLSGCSNGAVDTQATTDASIKATVSADVSTDIKATSDNRGLDAKTLADLIYSNATFEDMMTTDIPAASIIKIYGLPSDYEGDCAIYVSTGATPEELAVFEVTDSCTADDIIQIAEARLEKQTEGYASYGPDQVPKLDSSVVYSGSGYVVVCVSADNAAAAKFIKDYI